MRVLVVEGSAERMALLREGLRQAGYQVAACISSPLALLHAIEQEKPDVIVIDTAFVEAALARVEELQGLRAELAEANLKLSERKLVERAKGVLMKRQDLDEEAAYTALRRMAMDRKLRIAEVAQRILDAADLLGA